MANFAGGTYEQQQKDPVIQLVASGSYRDIPKYIIQDYFDAKISQEKAISLITGTPVYDPTKGPMIDTGAGPTPLAQTGFQFNVGEGTGFKTIQSDINQASALLSNIQIPKTITSSVATPSPVPAIPAPTAPTQNATYINTATQTATTARTAVETAYQAQLADTTKQRDIAQKKIEELNKQRQDTILLADPTKSQFYEQQVRIAQDELNAAEAGSKTLKANFEANQALTSELDTLLTQGNQLIEQQKAVTGLAAIRNPIIQKTIETVTARAGVIQAVMAARNGQINQAYNMINQANGTIQAQRNDQIQYYNTLLDFYGGLKTEEGQKVIRLTAEEKNIINSQIKLLENDLKQQEANTANIRKLMTDPDVALFMARAGVMLTDTPEQVNAKMATESARQQVEDTKNELVGKGYEYVPFPTNTSGLTPQIINGKTYYFKPPVEKPPTPEGTSTLLQRLLQGVGSINDLTPAEKTKIQNEAFNLGLYSTNPPDWFKRETEQVTSSSISLNELKRLWNEFRSPLTATSTTGGLDFNSF